MPTLGDALKLSIVITTVDRFSRTFDAINRRIESMAFQLNNKAGRAIAKFEREAAKSGKTFSASFRQMHDDINRLLVNASKLDMIGTTMTRIGIASGVATAGIVNLSASLEDKMARVRAISYNPFGDEAYKIQYEADMAELDAYVKNLGFKTPIKTEELADLAIVVAQLGLTGNDMETFMDTVAKIASIDQNLSPERWAEYLAKFRQTFKLTTEDMDDFASMLTYLATSTPAHAGEIAEAMFRTGKIAEGLSPQDIAAVNTALIQVGMTAERAGTATRRLFIDLADVNKMRKIIAFLDYDYDFAAFDALKESAPDAGAITKGLYSLGTAVPEDKLREYQTMFIQDPVLLLAEVLGQFAKKSEEQMAKLGGEVNFSKYFEEGELDELSTLFESVQDIISAGDIGAPIESVLRDIFNIRGTEAVQKLKTQVDALEKVRELAYEAWPTEKTRAETISRAISISIDRSKISEDELTELADNVDTILNNALQSGMLKTKEGFTYLMQEIFEVASIPAIDSTALKQSLLDIAERYDISLLQEKYNIRTESMAAQMVMARNAIVAALYQIGIALKPLVVDLAAFISKIATWFSKLPPMMQGFIAKGLIFTTVLGVIGGQAIKIIALVMRIKALIMAKELATRLKLIGAKDGLLFKIQYAFEVIKDKASGAFKWAKTFWNDVATGAKVVWHNMHKLPSAVGKGIKGLFSGLKFQAQMYLKGIGMFFSNMTHLVIGKIKMLVMGIGMYLSKVSILIGKIFAPIKALGVAAFAFIKAGVLGMWNGISYVFGLMMAHPAVLIFAAISAAIIGIIALVKNWGKVTEWIGRMFNNLKNIFRGVADFFKMLFKPIEDHFARMNGELDKLQAKTDTVRGTMAVQSDLYKIFEANVKTPDQLQQIIEALGERFVIASEKWIDLAPTEKALAQSRIVAVLADQIRDGKKIADDAMEYITEQMMLFLPQSPAKKGPLTKLEEAGRKIVEILSVNIEKEKNKAKDAMETLGNTIMTTLDNTLNSRTADVLSRFFKSLGKDEAITEINKVLAAVYNLQNSELGNSINEVTGGLLGNITSGIQAILGGKIGDLSGIITTFGAAIGADLTGLAAALGPIGIAIAGITAAFALFGDQQWFQDLTGPLLNSLGEIWDMFTAIFKPVGDLLSNIAPAIGEAIPKLLKALIMANPIIGGLSRTVQTVYKWLDRILKVAKDIFDPIAKQFRKIRDAFRSAFEPIQEAFSELWEAFKPLIDFGLDTLVRVVLFPLKMIAVVLSPVIKLLAFIVEKLSGFFKAIADFIKGITSTIEKVINDFTKGKTPWWQKMFQPKEETKAASTSLMENGTNNFDSFKNVVQQNTPNVDSAGKTINQSNTYNIQSDDPERIWRFIQRKIDLEALKSR